jgi:hypothetical protein
MVLLGLLFIYACGDTNTTKVPGRLLQPDSMKVLLHELYLADALNNERVARVGGLDHNAENYAYYQRIFELHGTNYEVFKESLDFYLEHPALFNTLTDSLAAYTDRLSSLSTPITSEIIPHGNNIKDSARSIRNKFLRR